jgi:hypothetical protein
LLYNSQGELVLGATSMDQPGPLFRMGPGVHEIAIELRLPLRPGLYYLDVSLNSHVLGQFERAQLAPALSVLPHGPTKMAERWQGVVNEPATFTLSTP